MGSKKKNIEFAIFALECILFLLVAFKLFALTDHIEDVNRKMLSSTKDLTMAVSYFEEIGTRPEAEHKAKAIDTGKMLLNRAAKEIRDLLGENQAYCDLGKNQEVRLEFKEDIMKLRGMLPPEFTVNGQNICKGTGLIVKDEGLWEKAKDSARVTNCFEYISVIIGFAIILLKIWFFKLP